MGDLALAQLSLKPEIKGRAALAIWPIVASWQHDVEWWHVEPTREQILKQLQAGQQAGELGARSLSAGSLVGNARFHR